MAVLTSLLFACLTFGKVWAQDPVKTDKYRVVLDNDRVRVIEYHDKPGEKPPCMRIRTLWFWRAVLLNGN